jgi:hypothetical protein
METVTIERTILIIKQHGNLDEIYSFFKELGIKKIYKLSSVKDWLGY